MNFVERAGAKYLTPMFMASGFGMSVAIGVLKRLTHVPRRWRSTLDQMHLSGIRSLHVVLFVIFFIGMILALQLGYELSRYGQQEAVGFAVAISMVREMAPVMTAVVLAASVASAMAAELGTMKVQEEITALEVMSVDVISYLIVPRVVALTLVAPMLTLLANIVGIVGGAEEGGPAAMAVDITNQMPVRWQDRRAIDEARGGCLIYDRKFQRKFPRDLVPQDEYGGLIG